nr:FAD-binding and (Fe-S)-binding domain-containing protein [uncultured Holophaga sp.]
MVSSVGNPGALRRDLEGILEGSRILDRPIDRVAFAGDASFYRMIPKAVVFPKTLEEVRGLFTYSRREHLPMTFRAAGTSLSGQAITEGVLVEVARHWKLLEVLDQGSRVRVQPGIVGDQVNRILKRSKAKIGPDPASINTCTIGGILSNNSSGMCCGVHNNAYHTLESLSFLLPSGTFINTADADADEQFHAREPELAQGLLALKAEIEAHPALSARIRAKYRTKNTTGYSLNAFIDFQRSVDIFRHLLVGSEGTLAFIAEAVLKTVPDLPAKVTGFLIFPDIRSACDAIVPLRAAGAAALELLDRASLRSVEDKEGTPASFKTLPDGAAALLAEFQGPEPAFLDALEQQALTACQDLKLLEPVHFTRDPGEQALMWKLRSGTFPSVGAVRASGTTVIIEDVAFPIEHLADATLDLQALFRKHRYDNAIIFGHAKDGNLHFVITPSFNDQQKVDQYATFIDDVVELVVKKYDGALKAEHGTGRNMAPFVEAEWGPEAKAIMERLKALVDPEHLLNPGVILNSDAEAHLHHLKAMPPVEEQVDKCIECGYCEPKCPSRELTLSPRQRIVVRREMARLVGSGEDPVLLASLQRDYAYMGIDTCAADGLCATACPVSIDTGSLIKFLRRTAHGPESQKIAHWVARHFATMEPMVRFGLRSGHVVQSVFGAGTMVGLTRIAKGILRRATYQWSPEMPRAAKAQLPVTSLAGAQAIYFPACISRMMGLLPGEPEGMSLPEAFVAVTQRAGVFIHIPEDAEGTCCGVPFSSKGYDQAHREVVNRTIEKFWAWSREGRLPVVVDTSPCTYGLVNARPYLNPENQTRFDRLQILDSVSFVHDQVLPKLSIKRRVGSVALHPVCSITKLGLAPKLEGIALACAEEVDVPLNAGCCGFAGDRGFSHPELTASATRREAADLAGKSHDGYYSSSRTCEVGMTRATGKVYRSYLFMLEAASR